MTPLAVLTGYLAQKRPAAVVLTVAEALVGEVLAKAGFTVTTDPAKADVVVVSFDRTFSQLERLQPMRLGQPVLPKLEVHRSRS